MQDYVKKMDQINQAFEQFTSVVTANLKEVKQLKQYQLTPQQELVMFYIIRQESVIAKDIASYLSVTKSAVSQVIAKLEEREMVSRSKNPLNKTETFIKLGSRGREYSKLLLKVDELLVENYYSKVSIEEP